VVHRIAYSFNYFFLFVDLFTQFIVDKMKRGVLYQVKQINHICFNILLTVRLNIFIY